MRVEGHNDRPSVSTAGFLDDCLDDRLMADVNAVKDTDCQDGWRTECFRRIYVWRGGHRESTELVYCERVVYAIVADLGPPQLGQMGTDVEVLPDIMGEAADVCAF